MQIDVIGTITEKIKDDAPKKCSIDFCDNYLKYILEYNCQRLNNDTELWEDKYIYNHYTFNKQNISSTLLYFTNESLIWYVELGISSGHLISIPFTTYEDAKKLHKELLNWLYNSQF